MESTIQFIRVTRSPQNPKTPNKPIKLISFINERAKARLVCQSTILSPFFHFYILTDRLLIIDIVEIIIRHEKALIEFYYNLTIIKYYKSCANNLVAPIN